MQPVKFTPEDVELFNKVMAEAYPRCSSREELEKLRGLVRKLGAVMLEAEKGGFAVGFTFHEPIF